MSSQQPVNLVTYKYDALDKLVSDLHPGTPARQRFYCKKRLVTEIQGALRQSIVQSGDLLLAQQQRQGQSVETALLGTDPQRSVLHTLAKDQPAQPIAYSPYGHHRGESGLSSLLGFNGERPDPVTGHYLLGQGYRAYNPVLMRFNCPDSWSPFDRGGLNAYGYCVGNPVNRVDPTGHASLYSVTNLFKPFLKTKQGGFKQIGVFAGYKSDIHAIGTPASKFADTPLMIKKTPAAQFATDSRIPNTDGGEFFGVYVPEEFGSSPLIPKGEFGIIPTELHDKLVFSAVRPSPVYPLKSRALTRVGGDPLKPSDGPTPPTSPGPGSSSTAGASYIGDGQNLAADQLEAKFLRVKHNIRTGQGAETGKRYNVR